MPWWKIRPELLLMPNVPKPLHGLAPRTVLGPVWWERIRLAAYRSVGFRCAACGIHKSEAEEHRWLEAHEVYDIDYPRGTAVYVETVPLCHYCHNFIHDGRLLVLARTGQISREKYDAVMEHGRRVLRKAGLRKKPVRPKRIARWNLWRLVVNGVEYPGRFKDAEDWRRAYATVAE